MVSPAVIVTGGAGYIGSHICKELKNNGFSPITIDNLCFGHQEAVQWGPLEQGDIKDSPFLEKVIKKYNPIGVIHCAAFAYVGESVEDPGKYYDNNVVGSLRLLEACKANHLKFFILSSTCATYGEVNQVPINESHPQNPINPYGSSKLMVERMITDFGNAHGLSYAFLRYFNASGADSACEIGENHDPETHLIPLIFDAITGKTQKLSVFGNTYKTPDGTPIRDYIHVSDLASAHVLALKKLQAGKKSLILNLGSGKGFSVQEVIAAAEKVTGLKVPLEVTKKREGDPPKLVSDITLACNELGWSPKHSDLETIIKTAWAWYQKLAALSKPDREKALAR